MFRHCCGGQKAYGRMIKDDLLCISLGIHGFAGFYGCGSPCMEWDIFASTSGWKSDQKKPFVLNNLNQYVFVEDMK